MSVYYVVRYSSLLKQQAVSLLIILLYNLCWNVFAVASKRGRIITNYSIVDK
jgi:hypothetical protein